MSGPTTLEPPQTATQQASGTETSTMNANPAASLRALALSTLKRRKIGAPNGTDAPASLPSRPVLNDTSIQLNYGPEEPSPGASSTGSPVAGPSSAARSTPPLPPQNVAMDVDEDQAREEGEISDSESTPVPKLPPTPPKNVPAKPQPLTLNLPMKPTSSPLAASSQLPKTEVTPHPLPEPPAPPAVKPASSARQSTSSDHKMGGIDDSQVRPGVRSQSYNASPPLIDRTTHVTKYSDASSVRHCERYCPRSTWLGRASGVPRRMWSQSRDYLLCFS